MIKFKIYIITIIASILFFSCEKKPKNGAPYSIDFDLNLDLYPKLKAELNSYLICPDDLHSQYVFWGGSPAGVIVYHTPLDFYVAYDRCCRNDACEPKINSAPKSIAVVPDGNGYAVCPSCGTKYLLYMGDGQVVEGSSKKALWVYPQPIVRENRLLLKYTAK